ncbi:hypothetical protein ACQ4PT_018945 [Festuca glaucescens]
MLHLQGFVADSNLRGFDLNQMADGNATPTPSTTATHEENAAPQFRPRLQSAASGNIAEAAEENGDEISSQPVVPYVGMMFDDLEVAKKVYNEYAFKLGFGIHIGNTKYSQARGATKEDILSRVFECVHAGKPINATKKSTSMRDAPVESDMSIFSAHKSKSKQAAMMMDVKDTRQRNKVMWHDCKEHMVVGRRDKAWTVTIFNAEHTHPMVSQVGRRRYYHSHRRLPEEDFQFIQTLHNQNINTAKIMGALADVHSVDVRGLSYVKRDVSNIRTMLRDEVTLRDMSITIEYFEKRRT